MFQFQNSIFLEKYAIIHMASLMWWCRNMDHRTFFYTSNTILWIKFYCFSFSKSLLKFIQIFFKSSQLGIFHISSEVLFLHVSYSKIFKKTKNIFILKYITYFFHMGWNLKKGGKVLKKFKWGKICERGWETFSSTFLEVEFVFAGNIASAGCCCQFIFNLYTMIFMNWYK